MKVPGLGEVSPAVVRRGFARIGLSIGALVGLPFRWLGGLVPRDPHLAVFGGTGGRFADNPRSLFLSLSDDEVLDCVWIAHDRALRDELRGLGHRSELRWSAAGLRTCLRAGWYLYGSYVGDVNYWTSKGARTVNLWHGVGIKAVEFAITTGPLKRVYDSPPWSPLRLAFIDRFHRPDHFLTYSEYSTEHCFRTAFRLTPEQCLQFGSPRTDHFFDPDATAVARDALGLPDGTGEVIGYFPTWRDQGNDFIAEAGFSFDELDEILGRAGRFLVFKAHPNFSYITPKNPNWGNIRVLDASADINQVLPACDAIITDYSSVAYDFLLLLRPVIFYVPDYDRYVSKRNANFSFDEMAVGPIVRETSELYCMLGAPTLPHVDPVHQQHVRELLWNGYEGDATAKLREFLRQGA